MDGVLTNFVLGAERAHGKESGSTYSLPSSKGKFELEELWGVSQEAFWAPTNSREFWLSLEEHEEAREIVELALQVSGGQVAILTAPSLFDGCIGAKREWVENHFPFLGKRVIYCPAETKRFLASPKSILLDDRSRNIRDWTWAGGKAVTVPRPWNDMWHWSGQVMSYLRANI